MLMMETLLMETLSEKHAFIIRVKKKLRSGGGWTNKGKDKTILYEKFWLTPVTDTFSSEMSLPISLATERPKKFNYKVSKVSGTLPV